MNTISTSASLVDVLDCPICGSPSNSAFESFDDARGKITYRLCASCGTVFQSPRMTDFALESYYETEYVSQHQLATGVTEKELRIQAGRSRHLVQMLNTELTVVERHLDIGSSTGSLMSAVSEMYGNEARGVEPAKVYRAYCAARGLTVAPDLESLSNGRFDLITMAHVVEHLPDPVNYLKIIQEEWLTPAGRLLVEVPNLYGHRSVEIPHLFCFSAETLRYTLAQAGYEVIRIERHGSPRSKLIPLYLTVIAKPATGSTVTRPNARAVHLKRRSGMAWNKFASRIAPAWAWLPLPSLEGEPE